VNRAIQGASDVDTVVCDVLDVLLEIFSCDRASLLYPCDPASPTWRVVAECSRHALPGAIGDQLMNAGLAASMRRLLDAGRPVTFGAGGEMALDPEMRDRFGVQAALATAIDPRIDRPYWFGLHQCARPRAWTADEIRLFQEAGRRLADGLATHLVLRARRESERRLLDAERVAHLGYWEIDYTTGSVMWSDETYRIWGLAPGGPLVLEELTARIHPEDRDRVLTSIADSVDRGVPHDLQYRGVRPDGDVRFLHSQGEIMRDASGRPVRFFGTVQDITERRRAEQATVESHNLLDALIEGTDDAVFVKDLDGRYLMINSAGAHRMRREPHQIIGRTDAMLWPAELADTIARQDRDVVAGGRPQSFEMEFASDDGPRTVLTRKTPFRDVGGRVVGVFGIGRDITEQKRLEEQFRQSQKMEAVGRLAGGVAHDFNNLLTVIHGFTTMVFERLPGADANREPLAEVIKAADRAANLTRQLLVFSRKQTLRPRIVEVNALVSDLHRLLRRLIGEDIEFTLTLRGATAFAEVDPGPFEQAIITLAVNARDSMPAGGRLVIETSETEIGGRPANPDAKPGRYVRIAVRDSGTGMDDATQARIFEPFFTTKGPGRGTGLGLAMVYGFVKQSDGLIEVTSAPGTGTTVDIYLPVARPAPAPLDSTERAPIGPPTGSETILLVEDENAVRSFARTVLESSGYTVLVARDGEDGVARAAAHDGPIDLLLTDVVMPRLGGPQCAEALRHVRPNIRVLFMSGYSDQPLPPPAGFAGAGFLQKPFGALDLVRKVRRVLDGAADRTA
jgi:PAS domain S-box-containing protein